MVVQVVEGVLEVPCSIKCFVQNLLILVEFLILGDIDSTVDTSITVSLDRLLADERSTFTFHVSVRVFGRLSLEGTTHLLGSGLTSAEDVLWDLRLRLKVLTVSKSIVHFLLLLLELAAAPSTLRQKLTPVHFGLPCYTSTL